MKNTWIQEEKDGEALWHWFSSATGVGAICGWPVPDESCHKLKDNHPSGYPDIEGEAVCPRCQAAWDVLHQERSVILTAELREAIKQVFDHGYWYFQAAIEQFAGDRGGHGCDPGDTTAEENTFDEVDAVYTLLRPMAKGDPQKEEVIVLTRELREAFSRIFVDGANQCAAVAETQQCVEEPEIACVHPACHRPSLDYGQDGTEPSYRLVYPLTAFAVDGSVYDD